MLAAVIPVYNPEPSLAALCAALAGKGFLVVVVDDGSEEDRHRFGQLAAGVRILHHAVNRGKGCAIKTGLRYLLEQAPEVSTVVFADGDGQHRIDDIAAVATRAQETDRVTLGVRNFLRKGVPFRSLWGNLWSAGVIWAYTGYRVGDTQTGLRAVPRRLWPRFLALGGERFEYEVRLFPLLKALGEPLEQVPIETVYIDSNRASHYSPLRDTCRMFAALFRRLDK